jgi:hypothetical protein
VWTAAASIKHQAQQQALVELHYPLLQLVVGEGDVVAVSDMIQDINHSLS